MANEPNLLRDNSLLRDQAPAGAPKGLSDPLGGAAAKARAAANDDRETIGAILRSLQYHPREGTYIVATLFALA